MAQISLVWAPNPASDNVSNYQVWGAAGHAVAFGSSAKIADIGLATAWTGTGYAGEWTFYIVAQNAAGSAAPSAAFDIVSAPNVWRPYYSHPGSLDAGEELFTIEMLGGETLPASLTGSLGGCGMAPTGSIAVALSKNGSSIGTINIASAATSATFTFASAVTFSAGDKFKAVGPSPADATLADLYFTLAGTR